MSVVRVRRVAGPVGPAADRGPVTPAAALPTRWRRKSGWRQWHHRYDRCPCRDVAAPAARVKSPGTLFFPSGLTPGLDTIPQESRPDSLRLWEPVPFNGSLSRRERKRGMTCCWLVAAG
jgi:hypothetical protein